MLSYLTTGSILFSLYTYFSGQSLKKTFQKELNGIIAKHFNEFQNLETNNPKEFYNFINSNVGIIMGSATPDNLKKCIAGSAALSAAWIAPLLFGALNYFFGDTSYKLYSSIVAVIVAVINFKSGLDSAFATQDDEQNFLRAAMNYKSNYPNDETVKQIIDNNPIMGDWQAEIAINKMKRWLDQTISIVQCDKLGIK